MSVLNSPVIKVLVACMTCGLIVTAIALVFLLDAGYFSTTLQPFDLNDVTLQYPILPDSISGYVNVIASFIIDVVLVCVWVLLDSKLNPMSDKTRNKVKLLLGVVVVVYGTALVNLLTNIMKHYMGGLRPHFIAACELDEAVVKQITDNGGSWVDVDATKTICTSDGKLDYRWGFPSGHTSQACYAMMLATLIVNSWDTLWSRYHFALPIKGTAQFLFLSYASLVSLSRIVDYHHHWYDVVAGAVLGTVLAVATHSWFLVPVMEMKEKSAKENAISLDRADSDIA